MTNKERLLSITDFSVPVPAEFKKIVISIRYGMFKGSYRKNKKKLRKCFKNIIKDKGYVLVIRK